MVPRQILTDRLLNNSTFDPHTCCWVWQKSREQGYGKIGIDGKSRLAHRVSYTVFMGPIPDGLHADHTCRNRACINPAHLEPVTQRENTLRSPTASTINKVKTHCPRGHSFSPENTYLNRARPQSPFRVCRICNNASSAEWKRRNRRRANQCHAEQ